MRHTLKPNQNLKIFFVCLNYWDLYNFRLDVLKHFINLGYEVHTVALKDEFAEKISGIGCKVHFIKFNNRGLNPFADIKLLISLKKLYKQTKPDLIFHYTIKLNIYGSLASSQLKILSVAVITGLGYAFSSHNWLSVLAIKLYRYALKNVQHVWILNEADKNILVQKKIVAPEKINLLHSEGINGERFKRTAEKIKTDDFIFLMATRILWSKGVGVFAEASKILQHKGYKFKCLVIGLIEQNHPDTIPLKKLTEWQNQNLISYAGFFEDVVPFLASADCFVLPSYYNEGVPRSLLEACAMQLPVITTNNNGCKEVVVDNFNGFICEKKNAEDLALKMERILLSSTERLKEIGKNGKKLVEEKFNVKQILKQYEDLIKSFKLIKF